MVLGNSKRPAELRARRARVCVREFRNERCGNAGRLLRILERVRLDRRAVGREAARRTLDELAILQPSGDDFAADGVCERDIRADIDSQPTIGPSSARRPAGIDDVQLGAVAYAAQDVMEEDRMRLARIRSPEHDQVGALDLLVGARAAACPEYRRQTDDARGMSSSIAAVDVVAADDRTSELLGDVVHLVGGLRAAEHPKGASAATLPRVGQSRSGAVERLVPGSAAQGSAITHEGMRQPKMRFFHERVIRASPERSPPRPFYNVGWPSSGATLGQRSFATAEARPVREGSTEAWIFRRLPSTRTVDSSATKTQKSGCLRTASSMEPAASKAFAAIGCPKSASSFWSCCAITSTGSRPLQRFLR